MISGFKVIELAASITETAVEAKIIASSQTTCAFLEAVTNKLKELSKELDKELGG